MPGIGSCTLHGTPMVQENDGSRTFYRIFIILIEVVYGVSSCSSIVSRTRRQRLEAMARSKRDTPFVVDDILALLVVTDESASTIIESARSHYAAAKPDLAFRVVLIADTPGGAAAEAHEALKQEYSNVLLFVKEELARQEYVMNVQVFLPHRRQPARNLSSTRCDSCNSRANTHADPPRRGQSALNLAWQCLVKHI